MRLSQSPTSPTPLSTLPQWWSRSQILMERRVSGQRDRQGLVPFTSPQRPPGPGTWPLLLSRQACFSVPGKLTGPHTRVSQYPTCAS